MWRGRRRRDRHYLGISDLRGVLGLPCHFRGCPKAEDRTAAEKEGGEVIELLPCPFCNGKAEIERLGDRGQSTIYACTECSCRLETGEEWGHGARWNMRAGVHHEPPSEWIREEGDDDDVEDDGDESIGFVEEDLLRAAEAVVDRMDNECVSYASYGGPTMQAERNAEQRLAGAREVLKAMRIAVGVIE